MPLKFKRIDWLIYIEISSELFPSLSFSFYPKLLLIIIEMTKRKELKGLRVLFEYSDPTPCRTTTIVVILLVLAAVLKFLFLT